jgi:hypothetical protein
MEVRIRLEVEGLPGDEIDLEKSIENLKQIARQYDNSSNPQVVTLTLTLRGLVRYSDEGSPGTIIPPAAMHDPEQWAYRE